MSFLYYVYCNEILGVRTNIRDFRWVYGSVAPPSSCEKYEKCKVKFTVCVKPEKQLGSIESCNKKFQAFSWDDSSKVIYYRRKFFNLVNVGYNIKVENNEVFAEIGENYYRFIQNRVMNLHSIYYLLSDLANIILLSNGFLTMYASAVQNNLTGKSVVCFGAPNTGKTFTAVKLCKTTEYSLIGEDIVISDGRNLYACPWTCSYRKNTSNGVDNAGSGKRINRGAELEFLNSSPLTDVVVLSLGTEKTMTDKSIIFDKASILNGYLFNYYSSPIIKVLGFFDEEKSIQWQKLADEMLNHVVNISDCHFLQLESATKFADEIHKKMLGKKI